MCLCSIRSCAAVRGQALVIRKFDFNDDGVVSRREAEAANRAFADSVGSRRRGFDRHSREGADAVSVERDGWDHRAMRDYGFRQTPRGATMELQEDVLFRADNAELRPGAVDKLRLNRRMEVTLLGQRAERFISRD